MVTAIAGGLSASIIQFVAPDSFTVFLSVFLLVGVVVGDIALIWGALIGAALIVYVHNIAADVSKAATNGIFGLFLIAIMYFMPNGVWGGVRRVFNRVDSRRPAPAAKTAEAKRQFGQFTKLKATGHGNGGPRHIARLVRQQECHDIRDILGLARTLERYRPYHTVDVVLDVVLNCGTAKPGLDIAQSNKVGATARISIWIAALGAADRMSRGGDRSTAR